MGDPTYVYTPWSNDRRARASVVARRRLGAPPGHCIVYGQFVPEEKADGIRVAAQKIAGKEGAVSASAFVKRCEARGWRIVQDREWSGREDAALRGYHYANLTARQIADKLGRSRNSIIGRRHRLKLNSPPRGLKHFPVEEAAQMAAEHLESPVGSAEGNAALFLVAPMFISVTPYNIAAYTGIGLETVRSYWGKMARAGLWSESGPNDRERYMGEGEENFLNLILDTLLCLGRVRRAAGSDGEDLWFK